MTVRPCLPDRLPLEELDWKALASLLGSAREALGRYDGFLQNLPNPAVLLSPTLTNEALLSSKIEGTQATLDDVFEHDAGLQTEAGKEADVEEVKNYRKALRFASQEVVDKGLRLSLIKQIHQQLMSGVRGHDKDPGNFRNTQNWIGRAGDSIGKARFVPPQPVAMLDALENFEVYINEKPYDPVLQVAISHAQFEIIHPFNDGNGRIGRILIPLLLMKNATLSSPMFYMSEYLEDHRQAYYDHLLGITEEKRWDAWIAFFIRGVTFQAEKNLKKARLIMTLYEDLKEKFVKTTHSQYAIQALDAFFSLPMINAVDFEKVGGFKNRFTANNILKQLEATKLITKFRAGKGRKPAVYALARLVSIMNAKL